MKKGEINNISRTRLLPEDGGMHATDTQPTALHDKT